MATHTGKEGVVKIDANTVAEVRSFDVTEDIDTVDDTVMGDTAKTHIALYTGWSGSCSVLWDDTDTTGQGAMTVGASVTIAFQPEGDTTGDAKISGTATVTSRKIGATHDGVTEMSLDLLGNGALVTGTAA